MPKFTEILIVGCGNPLFADDGFGPAVAEEMQKFSLPENIGVVDAGLGGPHFIFPLLDPKVTKKLIIVCTADFDAEPGTIAKFHIEDLPSGSFRDAHSWDLDEPLKRIKDQIDITVIGCQPKRIPTDFEIGISDEVSRAIPKTIRIILEMIGVDYRNAIRKVEPKPQTDFTQKNPTLWGKGYIIQNRYEIVDIKKGGMGIVYIAHDHECDRIFAIKTFQDKYLWDENVIQRFMSEAETWTELERHTNIVFAIFVRKIEGKPLLFLEYIDGGDLNPFVGKFTLDESLDFAIQFCTGMEYANQKVGVIHRDIKPGNVMVQKDPRFRFGYAFKITDFGLVNVLGDKFQDEFIESVKISTGMGTPLFMPPEQYPMQIQEKFSFKGQVTTRSDIYSFGVTLYLLLTGKLPFNDMNEIFTKRPESPKNLNPKMPERLDILIIKCLEKNPDKRYTDFTELRENLVEIYNDLTGERYVIVGKKEPLTDVDWYNKGGALYELGKLQEAIECCDKALGINPRSVAAWVEKGNALDTLGKPQDAIVCYGKALEINPKEATAWCNKGVALNTLEKYQEAIECCDKALEINPRDEGAWNTKGGALAHLGKPEEAIGCLDKALEINPREDRAWNNKGVALKNLGKLPEAIGCYDKSLEINPRSDLAWYNKGVALGNLGQFREAIGCCDKALVINPRDEGAWVTKGVALYNLGKLPEAIECYNKALEINPRDEGAWVTKGNALADLEKPQEAIECYDKALEINPNSETLWWKMGGILVFLKRYEEALVACDRTLQINPNNASAWHNKGGVLLFLKRYEESLAACNRALQINPNDSFALGNKVSAFTGLKRDMEALATYNQLIRLKPEYEEIMKQKDLVFIGH